jgi:hypothetical protein
MTTATQQLRERMSGTEKMNFMGRKQKNAYTTVSVSTGEYLIYSRKGVITHIT